MFSDIIWDFDGTLFDTYPAMASAFQMALKDEGIESSIDEILKLVRISMSYAIDYYMDNYKMDGNDFAERYAEYEGKIDAGKVLPFPNVIEICSRIIDKGGRNYILTHRDKSIFKFLKYHDMLNLFTEIVTKEYGFKRKPYPEAYLYILDKHNINRERALMIGDRELDIIGAKRAGIKACLFDTCSSDFGNQADYVIGFIMELEKIIF